MPKLNSFSLYLAKTGSTGFDDLLTQNARDMVKSGAAKKSVSNKFADGAALYVFPGQRTVPKWVALLSSSFNLPANVMAQSPCALLVFKKDRFTFAVTFAYAHVYLNDSKTEADFGLKVAVNAVSDERLRSVERSNIGAAIRDYAQAAGQRAAAKGKQKVGYQSEESYNGGTQHRGDGIQHQGRIYQTNPNYTGVVGLETGRLMGVGQTYEPHRFIPKPIPKASLRMFRKSSTTSNSATNSPPCPRPMRLEP
jgi:hypothetical protein